jgi:hypothetical protein
MRMGCLREGDGAAGTCASALQLPPRSSVDSTGASSVDSCTDILNIHKLCKEYISEVWTCTWCFLQAGERKVWPEALLRPVSGSENLKPW